MTYIDNLYKIKNGGKKHGCRQITYIRKYFNAVAAFVRGKGYVWIRDD
jgi:hypothetical protein